VNLERVTAYGRRVVAHNRQPHRLVGLPFQVVALVVATYGMCTGLTSTTPVLVAVGCSWLSMAISGVWWFMEPVVAGYRAGARTPK